MCLHAPSHYVLIPVHDGMPSHAKLPSTLVNIRHMAEHNGCSVLLLKISQFAIQPLQYIPRVLKLRDQIEIEEYAVIGIERDQF